MSSTHRRAESGAATPLLLLVSALLVFAPLFRGGNRPLPLLVLELLALAVFAWFVIQRQTPWTTLGRAERVTLGLIIAVPLVGLIPLPADWWSMLSGRSLYSEGLALHGETSEPLSLSLVPFATQASALALLPPIAVFLGTLACSDRERLKLVYVFLAIAGAQALLGLAQYGTQDVLLFLGMDPGAAAQGTYPNRNHFAGLFEMAFPLAAALFAATFGKRIEQSRRYRGRGLRAAFAALGEARINLYVVFLLLLALFGLAIVFSRSRTGIALLIFGVVLCALAFAPRLGGRRTIGSAAGVLVLLGSLAVAMGLVPVLQRFAEQDALADARWSIAESTVSAIGQSLPAGVGGGVYPEAMRRFHPDNIGRFINHAHNDYLEWVLEGGLMAGVVMLLVLLLVIRRNVSIVAETSWPQDRYLRVGAAIGLFLIALHGVVEYNLRIPANAVFFSFVMALFFASPAKDQTRAQALNHTKHGQTSRNQLQAAQVATQTVDLTSGDPNPFAR